MSTQKNADWFQLAMPIIHDITQHCHRFSAEDVWRCMDRLAHPRPSNGSCMAAALKRAGKLGWCSMTQDKKPVCRNRPGHPHDFNPQNVWQSNLCAAQDDPCAEPDPVEHIAQLEQDIQELRGKYQEATKALGLERGYRKQLENITRSYGLGIVLAVRKDKDELQEVFDQRFPYDVVWGNKFSWEKYLYFRQIFSAHYIKNQLRTLIQWEGLVNAQHCRNTLNKQLEDEVGRMNKGHRILDPF